MLSVLFVFIACSPMGRSGVPESQVSAQMLEGRWLLTEFHPELSLEPMLARLLDAELGRLVVVVNDEQLMASGRAVQFGSRYVVLDQLEDSLRIGIFGEQGVMTRFQVRRIGDELTFRCQDAPWRGVGTLAAIPQDDMEGEESATDVPAPFTKIPPAGHEE